MHVHAISPFHALLSLSLLAALGCTQTGLLYPGDELREDPPGHGLMVIGAEASIRLFRLEVCSEMSCLEIGPFMQAQEAYLVRLPVGEHCLTRVEAEYTGSVTGGGSGLGYVWTSEKACFRILDGGLEYIGSFSMRDDRLNVVRRPDIRALVQAHYPGLQDRDNVEPPQD